MNLQQIFTNNETWISGKLQVDEKYFENLAKGQSPEVLYIGCADSRVTAEDMMGLQPGEVFVHRNVANLVPPNDNNAMAVINYAVVHLKVKHAVVCGHYYCGGVKAAMQDADLGIINPWLREIRDVFRTHQAELMAIADEDARYKRLVELNVQEQCVNLMKLPEVQQAYRSGQLKVHGWVFDIGTGKLIDLEIDMDDVMSDIMEIYKLG